MKERLIGPLVFVGVAAAMGLLVLISPSLESSETQARKSAAERVEAARRVLARYNPHAALVLSVMQSASDRGLWPAMEAENVTALARGYSRDFQEIDQVVRDFAGAYERASGVAPEGSRELLLAWGWPESMIEGGFFARGQFGRREAELSNFLDGGRPESTFAELRALGGAPEQQARAVVEALERLRRELSDNAASLDEAEKLLLAAVNEDSECVEGHQLLASVHYLQGQRQRLAALDLRRQAEQLRPEIGRLSSALRRVRAVSEAIEQRRGIDESINEAEQQSAALQQQAADQEEVVTAARVARDDMLAQVAELRAARDRADERYLALTTALAERTQPGDFAQRLRAIREAGAALNEASRRLEETELGTVRHAAFEEDEENGEGRFVPEEAGGALGYEGGLPALQRDVAVAEARYQALRAALDDAQLHVERLRAIRQALAAAIERDRSRSEALSEELRTVIENCEALRGAAQAMEEEALARRIEPCLREAAQGERAQSSRMQEAAGIVGATAPRLEMISGEKWVGAGLLGLAAEARLLAAAIHYQRLADLTSHRAALAPAAESGISGLPTVDELAEEITAERALAAESAYAAAEAFQKAARAEGFWVYQGGMGVALAMLSQLDPNNTEYRDAAVAALKSSLDGRADHPAGVRLGATLRKLEADATVPIPETPDDADIEDDVNG